MKNANVPNCVFISEDAGEAGIRTTAPLKKKMAIATRILLMKRKLRWHRRMVSIGNAVDEMDKVETGGAGTAASIRSVIVTELTTYQRRIEFTKSGYTERYTGKIGGSCDDMCIALQICQRASEIWSEKYDYYRTLPPIWR